MGLPKGLDLGFPETDQGGASASVTLGRPEGMDVGLCLVPWNEDTLGRDGPCPPFQVNM